MKVLKWLWFLISILLIIISVYFMYQNNKPKLNNKTKKVVIKEDNFLDYNGDTISINGISKANAIKLVDTFTQSPLAIDSWWWMPNKDIPNLELLDNEYRLTIASYAINKMPIRPGDDSNKNITKTQVQTAWEDLVGLGVAITDGNPCTTIKYCNQYLTYDKDKDIYEYNDDPVKEKLQVIQYTDISLIDNEFIISLKAVYIDKRANQYTAYTSPNKLTKIRELSAINEGELEGDYLKRVSKDLFKQSDTYQYKFKYENTAFLFNGYNYIKTSI